MLTLPLVGGCDLAGTWEGECDGRDITLDLYSPSTGVWKGALDIEGDDDEELVVLAATAAEDSEHPATYTVVAVRL